MSLRKEVFLVCLHVYNSEGLPVSTPNVCCNSPHMRGIILDRLLPDEIPASRVEAAYKQPSSRYNHKVCNREHKKVPCKYFYECKARGAHVQFSKISPQTCCLLYVPFVVHGALRMCRRGARQSIQYSCQLLDLPQWAAPLSDCMLIVVKYGW